MKKKLKEETANASSHKPEPGFGCSCHGAEGLAVVTERIFCWLSLKWIFNMSG
jgi:hypothetical protein